MLFIFFFHPCFESCHCDLKDSFFFSIFWISSYRAMIVWSSRLMAWFSVTLVGSWRCFLSSSSFLHRFFFWFSTCFHIWCCTLLSSFVQILLTHSSTYANYLSLVVLMSALKIPFVAWDRLFAALVLLLFYLTIHYLFGLPVGRVFVQISCMALVSFAWCCSTVP